MRKASMVLGLIGGIMAILIALLIIAGGVFFSQALPALMDSELSAEYYDEIGELDADVDMDTAMSMVGVVFAGLGGLLLVAGILGVIGAAVVNKNNVLAGVLMLIGGVIAMITIYGFLCFILLILGGIFALVRDNSASQPTFSQDFE